MGQRYRKQHSLLTSGYVDYTCTPYLKEKADVNTLSDDTNHNNILLDHVLNHPELYKLENTCKCTPSATPNNHQTSAPTNNDCNDEWSQSTLQQDCHSCQQTERMSVVHQLLAKDLEYVDETYYADIKHYEYAPNNHPNQNQLPRISTTNNLAAAARVDDDDDDDDDQINENWGKVTAGEVASQTTKHTITLAGANDHQGGNSTALTAQSTITTLDLSGRSLVNLSSGIGYLKNLTKLNLSNNQLSTLPKSIGYLGNLTILNMAHNQLEILPDTMTHLTKLKAMNICHNNITHLPPCLGSLPELIIIIANNNQITWIPNEIANLQQMISFNISNNPLRCLPAEIANIKSLRKLIAEGCDFQTEFISKRHHDPPTLFEQCARTIVQRQLALPTQLPDHIRSYLSTPQACSYCHGPYFESFVTRGRFIERMGNQPIALEYRLCRAHWSDDQDRLLDLFSSSSSSVADQSELSSGGAYGDSDSLADTSGTHSSVAGRKRSESSSSSVSSLSRTGPILPRRILSLNTYSGDTNSSSLPATTPIHQETQISQHHQQAIARPRMNSFTKRIARVLSSSSSSSNNNNNNNNSGNGNRGGRNSKIMRASRRQSYLPQETTPTTMSPTDQKENDIHSPSKNEQAIYPLQHGDRHQHLTCSSYRTNGRRYQDGVDHQQSSTQTDHRLSTSIHYGNSDTDGNDMEQHNFMSLSQPIPLHASPA